MPLFGVPGERIAYTVHAGSGGPPLVLLHGFTASSASFVSNVPELRSSFTVITVDLLGHGRSEAPWEAEPYGPGPAVERLIGLLDHLGYDRVLLCGHSLGAALALRFALDAPGRVAGLVLINSNSAAGTPEWREAARPRMLEMAARARAEGTEFLRSTRLYPAHSKRLPPKARELLTRDFDRLPPQGFAGTAEALTIDVNAYERWPELAVPTLVVIGDRDVDFVRAAPGFLERLPAELVRTVTIEGAGHAANLEQPEVFDDALVEFAVDIGYLELAATETTRARRMPNQLFTVVGAALVVGGVALLVAAMTFGRGGGTSQPLAAAGDEPTRPAATPTLAEQVSGARTQGAGAATVSPTAVRTLAGAAPSSPVAATATLAAPTVAPTKSAATAPPATPTPAPTATSTSVPATSTPSGPYASFGGPAKADAGTPVTFVDSSNPTPFNWTWSASNGAGSNHTPSFTVAFGSPGCYSVTLTAFFSSTPNQLTATKTIAVGGAQCP